jgi:hypothetical protein
MVFTLTHHQLSKTQHSHLKQTYLNVRDDGSSCGFWAATCALMCLHGFDLCDEGVVNNMQNANVKDMCATWEEACNLFTSGPHRLMGSHINRLMSLTGV